jgi:hypothetical protein
VSYNASVEKSKNKNFVSILKKRSSLYQRWRCSCKFRSWTGANPEILSYLTSVANIYSSAGSLVSFEDKNIHFYFEKTL